MKTFSYLNFRDRFLMLLLWIFSLAFPVIGFLINDKLFVLVFTLLILPYSLMVIYNCFLKRIKISSKGVTYITPFKKYHLDWENIQVIGVSEFFAAMREGVSFIYFSTENQYMRGVKSKMICDKFIMLRYRKRVVQEIQKYWTGRIVGAYRI